MGELLAGIDIGTASTKAVLATPDGTVVATAPATHAMSHAAAGLGRDGRRARIWWDDVVAALPGARRRRPATRGSRGLRERPRAVPAAVRRGRPAAARRRSSTAIDMRADGGDRGADRALRRGRDPRALRLRALHQAVGPKLAWLRRNEPEVWARTRRWYMARTRSWSRRLTRRVRARPPLREPVRPALRPATRSDWATDWARGRSRPACELPRLAWPGEIVGDGRRRGGRADRPAGRARRSARARSTRGRRRSASASASPAT